MSMWALLSGACLLAGLGLWLWEMDIRKRRRRVVSEHLQTILEMRKDAPVDLIGVHSMGAEGQVALPWGPAWLRHPAVWRVVSVALIVACVLAVVLLLVGWSAAAAGVWCGTVGVGAVIAWRRWLQLRKQIEQQLPAFIDSMVRMVMLGHAVQSAFLLAAAATKMPLQATVNQAAAYAKAGMPVDAALQNASKAWGLEAFYLLSAIMQVGSRFGGRIDSLLERVAQFMRDREQAKQELHAMSSEVRLSAWVLSLLPIVIAAALIFTNGSYFLHMWQDASGRQVLFLAMGLQTLGVLLLYRLAQME